MRGACYNKSERRELYEKDTLFNATWTNIIQFTT